MRQKKQVRSASKYVAVGATLLVVFGAVGSTMAQFSGSGFGPMNGNQGQQMQPPMMNGQGGNGMGMNNPMGDPFKFLLKGINAHSLSNKIEELSNTCGNLEVEIDCESVDFSSVVEKLDEYQSKQEDLGLQLEELGTKMEDAMIDEDVVTQKSIKTEFNSLRKQMKSIDKERTKFAKSAIAQFKTTVKATQKIYKAAQKAQRDADKAEREADNAEREAEMKEMQKNFTQPNSMKGPMGPGMNGQQGPMGQQNGQNKNMPGKMNGGMNGGQFNPNMQPQMNGGMNNQMGPQNMPNQMNGGMNFDPNNMPACSAGQMPTQNAPCRIDMNGQMNGGQFDPNMRPPMNGGQFDPNMRPPMDGGQFDPNMRPPMDGGQMPPPPNNGGQQNPPM